jgi:hypothetical protein
MKHICSYQKKRDKKQNLLYGLDMNCVKGQNVAMMAWWSENNILGPILLPNEDNAPVLEQVDDLENYTEIEQRAHDFSSGGGLKLAGLAGMLFNNKNEKIGQQDMHEQFFPYKNIKKNKFPDTSNTHYQSHCTAATELVKHLSLYVEFMEWIRDGKDRPTLTNMERNIYRGLQDIPTQTELTVFVLYAQAVNHSYMRQVQGPGIENVNMLNLGPLHLKIQKHIEALIENPYILLSPHGSYQTGTMDGQPCESPEVMEMIHNLSSSLPHLQPVFVAFVKGALRTWIRFTSEFEEGGLIDQATTEKKERAWMPL